MPRPALRPLLAACGVALALAPAAPDAHAQRARPARTTRVQTVPPAAAAPSLASAPAASAAVLDSLAQRLDSLRLEQRRQGAVLDSFVAAQRPTRTQAVLAWVWPVLGAAAALFVLLALLGNLVRRRR